ncbi:MAG: LexA family transcriptional regulator [Selenomonadaceae bacterium]|nr:LexA family transcriptional regulator [Selenomonadaceae bacterium]
MNDKIDNKSRNMEHYGNKIKQFRVRAGKTAGELAAALDVSISTVRNWECGLTRPDPDYLYAMFPALGVSPNDFFGIQGFGGILTADEQGLIDDYRILDEHGKEDVRDFTASMKAKAWRRKVVRIYADLVSVPDYGRLAAAGAGEDWPDYPEENGTILYNGSLTNRADEIITVTGRSMEPQYMDKDRVLVAYCTELKVGDIGIFHVPGYGGVIKQKGHDRLHSLNPEFEDIFPNAEGAKLVGRILGKVEQDMIPSVEEASLYMDALSEKQAHPDWFREVPARRVGRRAA